MSAAAFAPEPLRQYALLADGERGALVGPRGDFAFLCAPNWHDDAVISSLLGGRGCYAVTPVERHGWGGHYDQDTLIWRSRWVGTDTTIECREALAFPGEPDRVVLLRRMEASTGPARVHVVLELAAHFGVCSMSAHRRDDGTWEGSTGELSFRWTGATEQAFLVDGHLELDLVVPEGGHHDLVLEIGRNGLAAAGPEPGRAWDRTERAWRDAVPSLDQSVAPGESQHSYAVLRGLTSHTGAMVAAATTSLPERARQGRNYDYRYAWIRDQCYAGQAAAAIGEHNLLDAAVRFVSERVLEDGLRLRPAYTVDGEPVPGERHLRLPGYPGAPVQVGNRANTQLQFDTFGEALLLLSAADRADRLDDDGSRAVDVLVDSIEPRQDDPDAGIWELEPRRWADSRLMCAAGLRAVAGRRPGTALAAEREKLADDGYVSGRRPSPALGRVSTRGRTDARLDRDHLRRRPRVARGGASTTHT